MSDGVRAAIIGGVLAIIVGGFAYVWKHIERNSIDTKTARILQREVVRPVLQDHEGRIRKLEKDY